MVNVFLIPGTELHLKSIRDGVSLELIEDVLRNEEKEMLRRIYENKQIRALMVSGRGEEGLNPMYHLKSRKEGTSMALW